MGSVISHNLATLQELETYYSLQDALNFLEVIKVRDYNQWAALEEGKRKSG